MAQLEKVSLFPGWYKLAEGQEAEADQLIEKAKKLDESALKEIVEDLDEDAGSKPDVAKKSPS